MLKRADLGLWQIARRTAFVARFIVLREARRTRAHRTIENLSWSPESTAEDLAKIFREAFVANGDKLGPVDRDVQRALKHADRSAHQFLEHYLCRATTNFCDALQDYLRSNELLFGDDEKEYPRVSGWRWEVQKASTKIQAEGATAQTDPATKKSKTASGHIVI